MVTNEEEVITTTPLRQKEEKKDLESQGLTSDEKQAVKETKKKRNCCELALDIIGCICVFLFSIFFMAASSYFHPGTWTNYFGRVDALFMMGTLAYITSLSIEITKRRSKGILEIVMTSIGVLGAFIWFVASFISDTKRFATTFIIGCLFVITFITYDLVMVIVRRGGGMSVFTLVSLSLAWLANILFMSGAGCIVAFFNSMSPTIQDVYTYAGLFISGSVFYFLHAIFYTVGVFTTCCEVSCSVKKSNE